MPPTLPTLARLAVVITLIASCAASEALSAAPTYTYDRPIRFGALKRADSDDRITGRLVSWDFESFSLVAGQDSTLTYQWGDFDGKGVYHRLRALVKRTDPDDAAMWARLGGLMYQMREIELAERALAVSEHLGAPPDWLEAMRTPPYTLPTDEPAPQRATRVDANAPRDAAKPAPDSDEPSITPIPGHRPIAPIWPDLTEDQRLAHTRRLKDLCADQITTLDHRMNLVETDHFLFYSDAGASEHKRWASRLERMYDELLATLDMPRDSELFQGKCVVWVFVNRDQFIAYEAAIHSYDARAVAGICHQRSGDCFVAFYRDTPDRFESVLIHETVHAFMYRYRSRHPLPTWANEGLADYIAGRLAERTQEPRTAWQHTRQFLRAGGKALDIMSQTYEDGTWFDENSYPVSHMLIRYMITTDPRTTRDWIDDIKDGKNWLESLRLRFGLTREQLSERFGEAILAEPSYQD